MSTITTNTHAFNRSHAGRLRFWLKRSVLGMLIVLIVLSGVGFAYQAVATALDRRAFPAPGQLVDVGGYRIHLHTKGENQGNPTAILIACGGCRNQRCGGPFWSRRSHVVKLRSESNYSRRNRRRDRDLRRIVFRVAAFEFSKLLAQAPDFTS